MNDPAQNPPTSLPQNRQDKHQKHQKSQKPQKKYQRCLAGYVLSRETALKLGRIIRGVAINPTTLKDENILVFPDDLRRAIRKDLISEGQNSWVTVRLTGATYPFEYIFATQGSSKFRGPPPEAVHREREEAVRKWLESKGNVSSSSHPHTAFSPYPQASVQTNIGGRSALMISIPSRIVAYYLSLHLVIGVPCTVQPTSHATQTHPL